MTLPAPNLDDRRFQELVDEAKRHVMARCPEWTDHNVSDPGVTLIETFAYMTDVLLYRLNRVPDRLYLKFLELIGLRLLPPTPARTTVTFWLTGPAQAPLTIAVGTEVATPRGEAEDPVVFTTAEELTIVPCHLDGLATLAEGSDRAEERKGQLDLRVRFPAFSQPPQPGDSLLVGLSDATPSNAVRLQFECTIEGIGVDPTDPPLVWEAWDGVRWEACEVGVDETGGLNRSGGITLHVPESHRATVLHGQRAGWLRARVVPAAEGQPAYTASPLIDGLVAATVGGTVTALHAEVIERELLGTSEGVPGQRFRVQRAPVLGGAGAPSLEVGSDAGWQAWQEVGDFAASGPDDRHFLFDAANGEVAFGPLVRTADGGYRQHGAVPPKGAMVRMRSYTVGGGRRGNVAAGAVRTLRSSIPFVARVENRVAATGGVDGEDLASAKERGPILLRTRGRAVTAEDFEQLTREAAPDVARVRCVAAADGGPDAGTVRVLITPAAPVEHGRIRFADLVPSVATLGAISDHLDRCRLVGTRVVIEPPTYQGVTVVARLRARPRASVARIRAEALERLETYFNPLVGGPDGTGWPWGRPVQSGDAFAVLQGIDGVELVEEVRLFGANPVTGERGPTTQRLAVAPDSLVFSYQHQVLVEEA